jgi:hypothetical protein
MSDILQNRASLLLGSKAQPFDQIEDLVIGIFEIYHKTLMNSGAKP